MQSSTQLAEPSRPADAPHLTFASGLPGFPGPRSFALEAGATRTARTASWSTSPSPRVRFLVVPPQVFFPEYDVELDDAVAAKVHLEDADDALLLVIVTLGRTAQEATANLLGPVVVNLRTLEGVQAVLADTDHGTRVPLAG